MAVFVITWNLNKERSNYDQARKEFLAQLEQYENKKDASLETVRWISTTSSADQIDSFLRAKMDANDRLFVAKIHTGEHQGWLSKDVWEWINSRL